MTIKNQKQNRWSRGACNWNATSNENIVTACRVHQEEAWVPCWTEVLFVSRICELWATTRRNYTYHKYPYHLARWLAGPSQTDCGWQQCPLCRRCPGCRQQLEYSRCTKDLMMRLSNAKARAVTTASKVSLKAEQAKEALWWNSFRTRSYQWRDCGPRLPPLKYGGHDSGRRYVGPGPPPVGGNARA